MNLSEVLKDPAFANLPEGDDEKKDAPPVFA